MSHTKQQKERAAAKARKALKPVANVAEKQVATMLSFERVKMTAAWDALEDAGYEPVAGDSTNLQIVVRGDRMSEMQDVIHSVNGGAYCGIRKVFETEFDNNFA